MALKDYSGNEAVQSRGQDLVSANRGKRKKKNLSENNGALSGTMHRRHQTQYVRTSLPLGGVAPVLDGRGNLRVILADQVDERRGREVLVRQLLHPTCYQEKKTQKKTKKNKQTVS